MKGGMTASTMGTYNKSSAYITGFDVGSGHMRITWLQYDVHVMHRMN